MGLNKKPDSFIKRFIEWAYYNGCPIMIEKEDGNWELAKVKKFDWIHHNYKIDTDQHKEYYSRLYVHGRM